jgi:hypothetical protein
MWFFKGFHVYIIYYEIWVGITMKMNGTMFRFRERVFTRERTVAVGVLKRNAPLIDALEEVRRANYNEGTSLKLLSPEVAAFMFDGSKDKMPGVTDVLPCPVAVAVGYQKGAALGSEIV